MLCIKNARVHDAIHSEPFEADILIEAGKIVRIAPDIAAYDECYDAGGMDVYPGFIDAHTHIGMFGYAGAMSKDDVEEYERCTPQLRGIDCINPNENSFARALRAGVTTVCVGPGSVNCIAGTHLAIKTFGHNISDMVVKDPVAMKIAFGQNPKAHLRAKLTTRMSIAACIRDTLYYARDYMCRKEAAGEDVLRRPAWNPGYEALIPVLKREIPLKAHAHRADDILTAIRIARELKLGLTLEHATDCGSIVEELAQAGYLVAVGPHISQPQKDENSNKQLKDVLRLIEAGVNVSVMTDSPITAEEYLPMCAQLLMREGLDEFRALQTLTINPARHLGIAERKGSLEPGKDADLVIARGNPIAQPVKPSAVFLEGTLRYQA